MNTKRFHDEAHRIRKASLKKFKALDGQNLKLCIREKDSTVDC